MRSLLISLLVVLLAATIQAGVFKKEKVKLGKKNCLCDFNIKIGDTCSGSAKCDKKCSGSGTVELGGCSFTLAVKKGKGKISKCSCEAATVPVPTEPTIGPGSGETPVPMTGSGSGETPVPMTGSGSGETPVPIPTSPGSGSGGEGMQCSCKCNCPDGSGECDCDCNCPMTSKALTCAPGFSKVCPMMGDMCPQDMDHICPHNAMSRMGGNAAEGMDKGCQCVPDFLLAMVMIQPTGRMEAVDRAMTKATIQVGKKKCKCSYEMNAENCKKSKIVCDKKCSGKESGVELADGDVMYMVDIAVKKGKVTIAKCDVEAPEPTGTGGGSTGSGSGNGEGGMGGMVSRCACVSKGMGGSGPTVPTLPPTGSGSEPAPPTGSGSEPAPPTGSGSGSGSRQGPLENDSKCGIPTGGRAECYFDCAISTSAQGSGQLIKDLTCLQDCFSSDMNEDDYCITSLLNDVISKGVCNLADEYGYNPGPGIYKPVVECGMSSVESNYGFSETVIDNGTCSDETEALLMTKTCRREIMEEQGFIQNTLLQLLQNSCNHNISQFYVNFMRGNLQGARRKRNAEEAQLHSRVKRLAPAQVIYGSDNISTILDFENTQNRYSWVCSLQSTGSPKEHLCAVTLLNLPPNPTVIVGAAHCTYLCKDGPSQVPPCCCSSGPGNCTVNKTQCGNTPKVAQMAEGDATIVCGRWKYDVAEEKEIVLDITEIVRHPDFDQARGPLSGSDIAVFKVDDSKIDREKQRLNPACLPSNNKPPSSGIHAGWSKPPPISYINNHAKEYAEFYDDFFKQWHYKMDILDKCEDPTVTAISGAALQFPSNSSYPAGTVCAKDFSKQSCFSTGESGSPLMIQSGDDSRYSIEGILSFVKGCDVFTFGTISTEKKNAQLNQQTENPSTYTKLACYLPWIAEQYGMDYEHSKDPACQSGSGNPDDGDQPCRITPSNLIELFSGEVECIFPFYYKGTKYNGCILFEEDGFVYPVFRCPTRNITTKIEEINSFEFLPLVDGYCPTDSMDPTSPLDPNETNCSPFARRSPFSQCKNNCPGVQALGIIGG